MLSEKLRHQAIQNLQSRKGAPDMVSVPFQNTQCMATQGLAFAQELQELKQRCFDSESLFTLQGHIKVKGSHKTIVVQYDRGSRNTKIPMIKAKGMEIPEAEYSCYAIKIYNLL